MDKQTRNLLFHEVGSGNLHLPVIGRKNIGAELYKYDVFYTL